MRRKSLARTRGTWLCAGALLWASAAESAPLTADDAVRLALQKNTQIAGAEASVLEARSGLWGAYAGVLPTISGSTSRSLTLTDYSRGSTILGSAIIPQAPANARSYSGNPAITGSWAFLNPSSLVGLSAARSGLKAARLQRSSTRQDVALATRQQFYQVVKAIHLARVSDSAVQLARDDERRVRALFEVGSVSRSDLLKAQVSTAQSELDSVTKHQDITVQRINLANQIGMDETRLGEVDTVLTVRPQEYDEGSLLAEARRSRPDLIAADAQVASAQASLRSAHWRRLPYLTAQAGYDFQTRSSTRITERNAFPPDTISNAFRATNFVFQGSVAINLDLFDGFLTDARVAQARASLVRARDARDMLQRNLSSQVKEALLNYQAALETDRVARRALESATENLKLTQEKYNVGSATILELIDAQVQLQRAQSDGVSALAAIRVAEAQIDRARGRVE